MLRLANCIKNFENYLYLEKNYSNKTIITYRNNLYDYARYLKDECNIAFVDEVTEAVIQNYIIFLKTKMKNKPRTINLKISTLKSFYRYLIEKKVITIAENVTYNLKLQKVSKSLPVYLTYEEAENFLLGTKLLSNNPSRDYALICLFLMTGARLSEVVNLTLGQINLTNKSVTYLGKGSKERSVPLIERVDTSLKEYIFNQSGDHDAVLNGRDPGANTDRVFLSKYRKPLSTRGIQDIVTTLLKATGIYRKGLSVHKLRHTCFTLLHRSGVDILTIKKIAGHENIRTTEIYTHINDKDLHASMEKNPLGSNSYDELFIQKIKDKYFNAGRTGKLIRKRRV